MEGFRGFVYSILVVSASGAAITMFAPENNGVKKYLHFLVSLVVTSVLLFPLCSVAGKLPDFTKYDIKFDTKGGDASLYAQTVAEQACKNIEDELSDRLFERFDITPTDIEVYSNGDIEEMMIEGVCVYYSKENRLLFSDTVNFIKGIFGGECEVTVMYENVKP